MKLRLLQSDLGLSCLYIDLLDKQLVYEFFEYLPYARVSIPLLNADVFQIPKFHMLANLFPSHELDVTSFSEPIHK